jgi:hypothetical protein
MLSGFYLTLLVGPIVVAPPPAEVIDAVSSVTVTTGSGQGGFQIAFTTGKASLINRVLIPSGYFDPGIRVIIVATVAGMPSVLMDGIITNHEVSPGGVSAGSTFTVTGSDLTVMMDLHEQPEMRYPNMNEQAAVMMILARYAYLGIIPAVVPPIFTSVRTATEEIHLQTGTDRAHVQTLAEQVGHIFYLDPGPAPGVSVAYWGPDMRNPLVQPALRTNSDAQTNVESLTFSLDGLSKKLVNAEVYDPETKKVTFSIPVPDVNPLRPPLGLRPLPPMKVQHLHFTTKLDATRAAAAALAQRIDSKDSITVNGQLDVLRYGRPLRARQKVGVSGAGLGYDGLYWVQTVTHNLKRGEYKQSFTLARDGLIANVPRLPA